jgi:hypothetical protein
MYNLPIVSGTITIHSINRSKVKFFTFFNNRSSWWYFIFKFLFSLGSLYPVLYIMYSKAAEKIVPQPKYNIILYASLICLLFLKLSERPGSNRRPSAWKADALPTELLSQCYYTIPLFNPFHISHLISKNSIQIWIFFHKSISS